MHSLIPYGSIGYRWWSGSFLVGVGAVAGAGIPIAHSDDPIGPSGCRYQNSCLGDRPAMAFGMLTLDVGLGF